jgi:predicted flap endonuclease-1-like 5' DNA nuclease
MAGRDFKNGPLWEMWAIAAGVGAVAFGVAFVVGKFDLTSAAFVGAVLAAVVVLGFGFPRSERRAAPPRHDAVRPAAPQAPAAVAPVTAPAAAAAMAPAAPVMAAPAPATPAVATPAGQSRPASLQAPRAGQADDLKIIKGVGPKLEQLCHQLGFYHYDQVAHWTAEEVAWVDDNLEGFKGRVTRDRWVPQAKAIVEMGPEAFLRALDAGREF